MKTRKEIKFLMIIVTTLIFLSAMFSSTLCGAKQATTQTAIQDLTGIDKSNWDYTDLELVSVGMTMTSDVPDMVVDSQGNIHIRFFCKSTIK